MIQFDSYVSDGLVQPPTRKFIVRQPPPKAFCFPTDSPHCQAAVRVEPPASYPGGEIAEPE